MQYAYAGIDVAFAKGKRLPIVICQWRGERLVPAPLRRLPVTPPVGSGNAQSCNAEVVQGFARAAAEYLRAVESHLGVRIVRIGIDAPSRPRAPSTPRRLCELSLDAAGINCFATPSEDDFVRIRAKVRQHLAAGRAEANLPHANQLWMQVGFALFRELAAVAECLEVYPQATVRQLNAGAVHKFKAGGLDAQLIAASAHTGWPHDGADTPLDEVAWGAAHDRLDAYLSAWVAALNEDDRVAFGTRSTDKIWIPRLNGHALEPRRPARSDSSSIPRMRSSAGIATRPPKGLSRVPNPRQCPACPHTFKDFPLGWDAHAAHRCTGLAASGAEARKREYRARFGQLFKVPET